MTLGLGRCVCLGAFEISLMSLAKRYPDTTACKSSFVFSFAGYMEEKDFCEGSTGKYTTVWDGH